MFRSIRILLICLIAASCCWAEDLHLEDEQDEALSMTSGEGIYTYDQEDPPEVFFFPKERAKWDGTKVTLSEWYMLTEPQKERFINEYLGELQGAYQMDLEVKSVDYLKALNIFSTYSTEKATQEPSTKFIDILLSGQGKLSARDRPRTDPKPVTTY